MITTYINTDYNYPIYIYFDKPEVNKSNNSREIHVYYDNASSRSCNQIECFDCPIIKECSNKLNLYHLIPDNIKNEYPELFI